MSLLSILYSSENLGDVKGTHEAMTFVFMSSLSASHQAPHFSSSCSAVRSDFCCCSLAVHFNDDLLTGFHQVLCFPQVHNTSCKPGMRESRIIRTSPRISRQAV
ncbi:hypothetical protein RRG08_065789 [Elysia crispata]|uniref:Uncharacterized protein n=1 Tax=Elysia crispata TaxID=231223 RepID=A0AAE0ZRI9_9GAST|nr:hypothetical protein RRG08_065789 [Elysia crispata]